MRKVILLAINGALTFIFVGSCNMRSERSDLMSDSVTYNRLIFNVALTNPDFNCVSCFTGPPSRYNRLRRDIVTKRKEVNSESIGVLMALHSWSDVGGGFPMSIIYICNNRGFEYAFPFFDEYYYSLHPEEVSNDRLRYELNKNLTFSRHLNFILGQLGLDSSASRAQIDAFTTLLADSLLGLKEYHVQDTSVLRQELSKTVEDATLYRDSCSGKTSKNIDQMVEEATKGNVRIFGCKEGEFGFWKFKIENFGLTNRLVVTFENQECYFVSTM